MKKWLIALLILIALFIAGCNSSQKTEELNCEKPYILYNNECCLDQNNNNLCDNTEKAAYISPEKTTSSSDVLTVTCPKEITFPTTISPSTQLEVKFAASYSGLGENSYLTGFICDDGYTETTNPIRVDLENGETEEIKTKVTLSPKECTFKLVESQNIDNVVSCNFKVKAI